MTDYKKYINALRKCAKEHENDRTLTGQIIVSDLCEAIADLLEKLSSSEEPNKSEIPTGSNTKDDLGVDCISRQELLKIYEDRFTELQKLKHLKDNKGAEDRQMGVNYCINILKELPPVTPQEPRWIPISEKLPEEDVAYLVTVKQGYVMPALWVGNAENWKEVTAWMPLPQPYKEVEE